MGPRLVIWLVVSACYHPAAATGVPCADTGQCPRDQVCDVRLTPPICVDEPGDEPRPDASQPIDGAMPMPDAETPRTIPPGAVLWLKLDDDPADGVLDSAGTHAVTCTSTCPQVVPGKFGSAYRFSGAQRLETPDAPELRPGTGFTAAAWVRLDALPTDTYGALTCKVLSEADASFCVSVRSNGKPTFYTPGNNTAEAAGSVAVGAWHHLAVTWDGTTKRGYLDGAQYATAPISTIGDAAEPFTVGAFQLDVFRLPGAIDDVVYYDRALSAAEVAQLAAP